MKNYSVIILPLCHTEIRVINELELVNSISNTKYRNEFFDRHLNSVSYRT